MKQPKIITQQPNIYTDSESADHTLQLDRIKKKHILTKNFRNIMKLKSQFPKSMISSFPLQDLLLKINYSK